MRVVAVPYWITRPAVAVRLGSSAPVADRTAARSSRSRPLAWMAVGELRCAIAIACSSGTGVAALAVRPGAMTGGVGTFGGGIIGFWALPTAGAAASAINNRLGIFMVGVRYRRRARRARSHVL